MCNYYTVALVCGTYFTAWEWNMSVTIMKCFINNILVLSNFKTHDWWFDIQTPSPTSKWRNVSGLVLQCIDIFTFVIKGHVLLKMLCWWLQKTSGVNLYLSIYFFDNKSHEPKTKTMCPIVNSSILSSLPTLSVRICSYLRCKNDPLNIYSFILEEDSVIS